VLAVAARSPADERSLMRDSDDVTTLELKVADAAGRFAEDALARSDGRTPPCSDWSAP